MNIIDALTSALKDHIKALLSIDHDALASIEVTLNTDAQKQQFGDISTNAALMLAKKVGTNPRSLAEQIIKDFSHLLVEKVEIAGPGFINIFLSNSAYVELAQQLLQNTEKTITPALKPKRYSIEFVSANPTGPLHIGHGRNAIIGDVLARVLRFTGNGVTTEFYVNDAGNQIAKLGESFRARYLQKLGIEVPFPEDGYHGEYLIELAQNLVRERGTQLEQESLTFFAEYAKEYLLAQQKQTLTDYKVHFDRWVSEKKELHDTHAITQAVETLQQSGFLYEAEGALWFKSTEFGDDKDRVVRKNTGELTYVAADIAYLEHKLARAEKLVMVLGQDHHSYVVRLKGIMQALGYNPDNLTVILYQLVTIKESGEQVRLSKRAGRIVELDDIIKTVGADVARFFYLHRKADAHLELDIDLALKHSEENPVYYIQYAYVRIMSILEKSRSIPELQDITPQDIKTISEAEKLLIKKMLSLETILKTIAEQYQTHQLAYYAVELAQSFHHFYAHERVIDTQDIATSRQRLALIASLQKSFKLCLELLGLTTPESM